MTDYYPTLAHFQELMAQGQQPKGLMKTLQQIVPGKLARTDSLPVDETIQDLDKRIAKETDPKRKQNMKNLRERTLSVSDLTQNVYNEFTQNPNSLYNWFSAIEKAVKQQDFFKTPKTVSVRLPIELAQFMRVEYQDTTAVSRDLFNKLLFDMLKLEDDKEYFIKTGTFSSKFEFRNAHLTEPREVGEYFQVINNFAMTVGAGLTVDIVCREYIQDKDNRPTIYNGMPLRTEFRAFVDFDTNTIEGVVPYWHPMVMKGALSRGLSDTIQQDYQTYLTIEDTLSTDYNQHVNAVTTHLQNMLADIDLTGRYSVDIMKNGDDFYIIDLATSETSALYELLPNKNGETVTFEDVYPEF